MSEQSKGAPSSSTMEDIVGRLLQVGTLIASVLIAIGVAGLVVNFSPLLSAQVVTAGLLALMATPVMRVLAALWVYLRERDYVFATISAAVLVILGIGILVGNTH